MHHNRNQLPVQLILFLGVFAIYALGMHGDFALDDGNNILFNANVAMIQMDWQSIKNAWHSGDAGPLGRPIPMLSFAINHYLTGFDPFYFKITNIFIHGINSILIYRLSLHITGQSSLNKQDQFIFAAICSMVWAFHPFNLTSVLYIVQRMTSLAAFFSLLAMLSYCNLRLRVVKSNQAIWFYIAIATATLFTFLALLCKENAFVTIPLLLILECCIFQYKSSEPALTKAIRITTRITIAACLVVSTAYIYQEFTTILNTYSIRTFSMKERLLTESRVIIFYIEQTFMPNIGKMGINHDDWMLSKTLTEPINTIYSIITIGILSLFASIIFFTHKQFRLIVFGWFFFLIGHLLESTIWPLELIFEHRNYLPSIGLIWAVAYILLINITNKRTLIVSLATLIVLTFASQTALRSYHWRSMTSHAITEVQNHPKSERANFQMARVYSKMYEANQDIRFAKQAAFYYQQAALLNTKESGALIGMLQLESFMQNKIEQSTLDSVVDRLRNQPMSPANISFLNNLSKCNTEGFCKLSSNQIQALYDAAYSNPTTRNDFKSLLDGNLAIFYSKKSDSITAEKYILSAIKNKPDALNNYNAAVFYYSLGTIDKSKMFLKTTIALDKNKTLNREITGLQVELRKISQ